MKKFDYILIEQKEIFKGQSYILLDGVYNTHSSKPQKFRRAKNTIIIPKESTKTRFSVGIFNEKWMFGKE